MYNYFITTVFALCSIHPHANKSRRREEQLPKIRIKNNSGYLYNTRQTYIITCMKYMRLTTVLKFLDKNDN